MKEKEEGGRRKKSEEGVFKTSSSCLKKPFGFRNRLLPVVTVSCLIVAEKHFFQDKVHLDQI